MVKLDNVTEGVLDVINDNKNKKNEPVKYHFTIYSYLCTQKTKAPMVKVRSTLKL